jgi:hypothetical protein
VSDEVSRLTTAGGHRFKLGGLLNQQRSSVGLIPNRYGTFTFNSLADFDANQPTQFTRTLFARDQQSATTNVAVYLGDSWRVEPQFQVTYGLRMEGSRYPDKPDYNPQVEAAFGRRTDNVPSEVRVSPRAGFSVFVGESQFGPPPLTLRGGIGEFRGTAPTQLFATALNATGLNNGQSTLTCVGSAAPTPDWASYLADPSTIPTSCNGGTPIFASQRRNVTVFDPSFEAPRAWRASLGLTRRFWDRYSFSVDAGYARGVAQTGQIDINLDTVPKFNLANENNRPVYAPRAAIVPTTGAVSVLGSRLIPQFGVVSQIESNLRSDTKQLTLGLNGITTKGILMSASYTLTSSFDQSQGFSQGTVQGFGGTPGSTAGNPNLSEWGRSDNARRHAILGTITYPIKPVLELTAIARATSGSYYSPLVGGDINGDGRSNNDRAFVFSPAAALAAGDTTVGNGMNRLLSGTSARARDCLLGQMNKVASRSSCSSPWAPFLDLQANIRPASFGLDRRLTISVMALNTLTGLDQLLHGSKNLHGWGQPSIPDRTLLYVRGFDPATDAYRYQVNEHFGVTNGTRNAFRVPFQIAIQGRLALGTDPARQQFNNVIGGGPGRLSLDALKARMTRLVPNAFLDIIAIDDSTRLELTPDQIAKLQSSGDAFKVKADSLIDNVANMLADTTVKSPDPMTVFAKLQPSMVEGRKLAIQAINDSKAILTPAQWAKVPENIKTPGLRRGDGEGGGRFDRGGGPG